MMLPELTTQSYALALPSNKDALEKIRELSAKLCVALTQSGAGAQESRALEARGLQPPMQKSPVPQKPKEEQQGASAPQRDVVLQVCCALARSSDEARGSAARSSLFMMVEVKGVNERICSKERQRRGRLVKAWQQSTVEIPADLIATCARFVMSVFGRRLFILVLAHCQA